MSQILFLTQVLPYPLDAGPKIRAYYVLRQLAKQHTITLVSFVREDDQTDYLTPLKEICQAVHTVPIKRSLSRNIWAVLKSLFTRKPVVILRDDIKTMRAKLKQLLATNTFDVVHADQTSMAQYALYAQDLARTSGEEIDIVLDAHNALYRVFTQLAEAPPNLLKQWFFRRESQLLMRYEISLYQRFTHIVFVTEPDRRALNVPTADHQRKYTIIPICIDLDDRPLIPVKYPAETITHLGTMFWPPNVEGVLWFAKKVFPRVLAQIPTAKFVIIGKNPPLEIQSLSEEENIQVTGYVADPEPYLAPN